MSKSSHLQTKLITAGRNARYTQGAVNSVIQRASSLVFDSVEQKQQATRDRADKALFYGRRGTLTHFALQDAMTELESGAGCVLFPCGAAAVANSILAFVKQGDHVVVSGSAYEPTQDFCNIILSNMGIPTTYLPNGCASKISQYLRPTTRVVFLESPASITMEIEDIPAIVSTVRALAPNAIIMLDNTWSAGVWFPALQLGVDISIQAGTKYLVGHSDAMIGTAVANQRCLATLRENAYLMGQMVDADTAYMTARGLRTLAVRLRQHEASAIQIAQWLLTRPEVSRVNHPALPESQGHAIWQRDFLGSSGLFSFVLEKKLSSRQLANFLNHFNLFKMAYSWGGFESLILASQPEELAKIRPADAINFNGTLIRLHIGLEHPQDLINDLARGFGRLLE
jgi:cysteine-S-conjugate beta-lyase